MSTRSPDPKHQYTVKEKNMLVRIAEYHIGHGGWSIKNVLDYFKRINHDVAESTLRKWRQEYRSRGEALSATVGSGPKKLLDSLQEEIFCGYILDENEKGNQLSQADLASFLKNNFSLQCTRQTAGNYARGLGYSYRDLETRKRTKQLSTHDLTDIALDWIKEKRMTNPDLSKVAYMDFTFSSHRHLTCRGYQKKGRKRSVVTRRSDKVHQLLRPAGLRGRRQPCTPHDVRLR